MNTIILAAALCSGTPCSVHGELTPRVVEAVQNTHAAPGVYTVVDGAKTYTITIKAAK